MTLVRTFFAFMGLSLLVTQCSSETNSQLQYKKIGAMPAWVQAKSLRICYKPESGVNQESMQTIRNNLNIAIENWTEKLTGRPSIAESCSFDSRNAGFTVVVHTSLDREYVTGNLTEMHLDDTTSYGVILHEVGHILGLGDTYVEGVWTCQQGQPTSVMCNHNNYTYLLARDDIEGATDLFCQKWGCGAVSDYQKGQEIGHANNVIAMTGNQNLLFAVTKDNKLWVRTLDERNINWQEIGTANNVTAMAAVSGKLYVATTENKLWVRNASDAGSAWTQIGHANDVVGLAGISGRLFAATKDNKLWVKAVDAGETGWREIGHANGIVSMTGVNSNLYAVDANSGLWSRSAVESNVEWKYIGYMEGVKGMAGASGKLFLATSSNKLFVQRLP